MNIRVNILSARSIAYARRKLDRFIEIVEKLETELPRLLAHYGATQAQVKFNEAMYNILWDYTWSTPNITVIPEANSTGWSVLASGHEVCFVEFGAGVAYESIRPYLGTRPPEIAGIGEYGEGYGKFNTWAFRDGTGRTVTRGTPANNCLYYTAREIEAKIEETAKRILTGND